VRTSCGSRKPSVGLEGRDRSWRSVVSPLTLEARYHEAGCARAALAPLGPC
jgi:hypothetical protein